MIDLKEIRTKLGLSQQQLADEIDECKSLICQFETNKRMYTLRPLLKIAALAKSQGVHIDLNDLINESFIKMFKK